MKRTLNVKTRLFFGIAVVLFLLVIGISFLTRNPPMQEIRLGISLPLSGINKALGRSVLQGAESGFRAANDAGGIRGHSIRLIAADDKYEPQITLKNTRKFLEEEKVFALFGFVGTPTVKKILPIVKDIPFVAPYTGASFLRDPSRKNIVNFRSSYHDEIKTIVDYLRAKKGFRRFAIFYQNDDYGIEGYNAAVSALRSHGLTLVGEGTYKRNTLSVRHALNEIQNSRPEAIIIVGAYKPSAYFIRQARQRCREDVVFAPISFVNADALVQELGGATRNILFSQTVPPYDDPSLAIAGAFRKSLKRYYPGARPTFAAFEGYLAAQAVIAALRKASWPISRDRFLQQLRALAPEDLSGLPIHYHRTQLLNRVYLSRYTDGTFLPIRFSGGRP